MNTLFMHCRPGFEGEVCAEISEHAATWAWPAMPRQAGSACAEFVCSEKTAPSA
jgi:23S rRNA (cytidine2498-2'-O)-methyltransferase